MQIYFFDELGYFTNTKIIKNEEDLEELENFTIKEVPNGLVKPIFKDDFWQEGACDKDLYKSLLNYDLKQLDIADLLLVILAYIKGGEDMFLQVLLNFWIERKIDQDYIDSAVQFKIITVEEANFIKLTPQVEI